jgi:sulfur-oxidizing protein SoxY
MYGSSAPRLELPRREALRLFGMLLVGGALLPLPAAWADAGSDETAAFAAGTLAKVLAALGARPEANDAIQLSVPDFVENGAVVPVEVTSTLSGAQQLYIISEANPFPLVAKFGFPEGTEPYVSTRIKVASSCNIYAVVKSQDRYYSAVKATQVTVGGCGA